MNKIYLIIIFVILNIGCSTKNTSIIKNNLEFTINNKYIEYSSKDEYPLFLMNEDYILGASVVFNNIEDSKVNIKSIFLENKSGKSDLMNKEVKTCDHKDIIGELVFIKNKTYIYLNNICVTIL